ncbi:hypothetical protein [Nitrospira sp. Nam80]
MGTVRAGTVQLHLIRRSQSILHTVTSRQPESVKRCIPTPLRSEQWPAPPIFQINVDGTIPHPLEQSVTELNVILANAPQTGCPLSHVSSLEKQ